MNETAAENRPDDVGTEETAPAELPRLPRPNRGKNAGETAVRGVFCAAYTP